MKKRIVWISVFFLGLLMSLCSCSSYYLQSVKGQFEVFTKQQPIERVLGASAGIGSKKLADKLRLVLNVRDYATNALKLPENNSYRLYADLGRPYVVWSVMAAPEFSLTPTTWCYPVVGCAAYRGYFHQRDAQAFAQTLVVQGLEVSVQGVPAYSTLGWFDDPVFHSVLHWPNARIAALIFHELAHAQIYIAGDTAFNESFATTVETEGVRRWLVALGDNGAWQRFQKYKRIKNEFISFVMIFRQRLTALYAQPLTPPEMRRQKHQIIADMHRRYAQVKAQWGGFAGYDAWMNEISNAKLNTISTYHQYVPAFQALLAEVEGNLSVFYQQVALLGNLDEDARRQHLDTLGSRPLVVK